MGARRTINRYRTEPSGYDFIAVLKKSKAFYRASNFFELSPFPDKDGRVFWQSGTETLYPLKRPHGTRCYRFNKTHKRWEEVAY